MNKLKPPSKAFETHTTLAPVLTASELKSTLPGEPRPSLAPGTKLRGPCSLPRQGSGKGFNSQRGIYSTWRYYRALAQTGRTSNDFSDFLRVSNVSNTTWQHATRTCRNPTELENRTICRFLTCNALPITTTSEMCSSGQQDLPQAALRVKPSPGGMFERGQVVRVYNDSG